MGIHSGVFQGLYLPLPGIKSGRSCPLIASVSSANNLSGFQSLEIHLQDVFLNEYYIVYLP